MGYHRSHMRPSLLFALALGAMGLSCAGSGGAEIQPFAPQTVAVYETLRVPIDVEGGSTSMTFGMVGPDLERFDRAASVSGTGAGGEFRWTPLANHVGTHEVQIVLLDGTNEIDYETIVVTVIGAADAAPVAARRPPHAHLPGDAHGVAVIRGSRVHRHLEGEGSRSRWSKPVQGGRYPLGRSIYSQLPGGEVTPPLRRARGSLQP